MIKYRIFIVEDDDVICEQEKAALTKWGYEVESVRDFNNVLVEFTKFDPHLVLMDVGLPFYNGHYWCGQIRTISQVPVIFVSSASDNMNIIMAVNMGGDDFVTKPFETEILAAKVQAMLRRTYAFHAQNSVMEYKGMILDVEKTAVVYNGEKVDLTKNEFRILQILMENAEKNVSREAIMKKLWDDDYFIDDNTLTVNVTRLRKKLDEFELGDYIQTKKGIGYCLIAERDSK